MVKARDCIGTCMVRKHESRGTSCLRMSSFFCDGSALLSPPVVNVARELSIIVGHRAKMRSFCCLSNLWHQLTSSVLSHQNLKGVVVYACHYVLHFVLFSQGRINVLGDVIDVFYLARNSFALLLHTPA